MKLQEEEHNIEKRDRRSVRGMWAIDQREMRNLGRKINTEKSDIEKKEEIFNRKNTNLENKEVQVWKEWKNACCLCKNWPGHLCRGREWVWAVLYVMLYFISAYSLYIYTVYTVWLMYRACCPTLEFEITTFIPDV